MYTKRNMGEGRGGEKEKGRKELESVLATERFFKSKASC